MLGRDHALSGALVGIVAADPAARLLGHSTLSPPTLLAVAAVTAGFALLPDVDEPGATISRKLGPVSEAVSAVTNKLSGGHRHATHSLLFVGVVAGGTAFAARTVYGGPAILWFALSLTLSLILPIRRRGLIALVVPVVAAAALLHSETGAWMPGAHLALAHAVWWLPWAAGVGVLCHLVGDAITVEGVPLLWPWNRHFGVPLVGHTESLRESIAGVVLFGSLAFFAWTLALHPEIVALQHRTAADLAHARALVHHVQDSVTNAQRQLRRISSGVGSAKSLISRLPRTP